VQRTQCCSIGYSGN